MDVSFKKVNYSLALRDAGVGEIESKAGNTYPVLIQLTSILCLMRLLLQDIATAKILN